MTNAIEVGDGIVFAVKHNRRFIGYASGQVSRINAHSYSVEQVEGPSAVRGNLPAWVMASSALATTISRGEAKMLAEKLNALVEEERAALCELPLHYEKMRASLIRKFNGEKKEDDQ